MNNDDEQFLESLGWTVECQSPFEIRHTDGSFATGQAARMVLLVERGDAEAEAAHLAGHKMPHDVHELVTLIKRVHALRDAARTGGTDEHWRMCYGLVFNDNCSGRIYELVRALNFTFSPESPDMGYDDDVLAFVRAIDDLEKILEPFVVAFESE